MKSLVTQYLSYLHHVDKDWSLSWWGQARLEASNHLTMALVMPQTVAVSPTGGRNVVWTQYARVLCLPHWRGPFTHHDLC